MLVKVSKKSGVREVLEARRVICHNVQVSWEVVGEVAVAMFPLVSAGKVAEVGCGSITGHRALVDTRDGGRVVGEVDKDGVACVVCRHYQVNLGEEARLFEVAVGDGTLRVVEGYEAALDIRRESLAPDVGSPEGEVDATHARFGRVGGTQETRILGDNLGEVLGWPGAQAGGKAGEGREVVLDG